MSRDEIYDRVYGLLVALCDVETRDAQTDRPADVDAAVDLRLAFNIVAEMHTPAHLVTTESQAYGELLDTVLALVGDLVSTTASLTESLWLLEVNNLLQSARGHQSLIAGGRP